MTHSQDRGPSWRRHLAFSLCVSLAGAGCSPSSLRGSFRDFNLPSASGDAVQLSEEVKKGVVVLQFFATWSSASRRVLGHLSDLHAKYRARGLTILAIAEDGPQSVAAVASFINTYRLPFPVLLDQETVAMAAYDPRAAIPCTVFLERDGTVLWIREGYIPGDEDELERQILRALGAPGRASPAESRCVSCAIKGLGPAAANRPSPAPSADQALQNHVTRFGSLFFAPARR